MSTSAAVLAPRPATSAPPGESLGDRVWRAWGMTTVTLVTHGIAVAATVLFCVYLGARIAATFAANDTEVPAMTQRSLDVCEWVNRNWYVLAAALLLVDLPLTFCLRLLPPGGRWPARAWHMLVPLAALTAIGLMTISFEFALRRGGIASLVESPPPQAAPEMPSQAAPEMPPPVVPLPVN